MLESLSVHEWESWLQRLDHKDVRWEEPEQLVFLVGVMLLLFPKRWIHELESALISQSSQQ